MAPSIHFVICVSNSCKSPLLLSLAISPRLRGSTKSANTAPENHCCCSRCKDDHHSSSFPSRPCPTPETQVTCVHSPSRIQPLISVHLHDSTQHTTTNSGQKNSICSHSAQPRFYTQPDFESSKHLLDLDICNSIRPLQQLKTNPFVQFFNTITIENQLPELQSPRLQLQLTYRPFTTANCCRELLPLNPLRPCCKTRNA